jgi:hypothetical protein
MPRSSGTQKVRRGLSAGQCVQTVAVRLIVERDAKPAPSRNRNTGPSTSTWAARNHQPSTPASFASKTRKSTPGGTEDAPERSGASDIPNEAAHRRLGHCVTSPMSPPAVPVRSARRKGAATPVRPSHHLPPSSRRPAGELRFSVKRDHGARQSSYSRRQLSKEFRRYHHLYGQFPPNFQRCPRRNPPISVERSVSTPPAKYL